MLDEHYLHPRLVDVYDLDSPWSTDREFYLGLAESRNPASDWTTEWNYRIVLDGSEDRVVESRRLIEKRDGLLSFELTYEFAEGTLVSASTLRFLERDEILDFLSTCGLRVTQMFGDWNERPFEKASSQEMIFIVTAEKLSTNRRS